VIEQYWIGADPGRLYSIAIQIYCERIARPPRCRGLPISVALKYYVLRFLKEWKEASDVLKITLTLSRGLRDDPRPKVL
jgi:hypothetical protein